MPMVMFMQLAVFCREGGSLLNWGKPVSIGIATLVCQKASATLDSTNQTNCFAYSLFTKCLNKIFGITAPNGTMHRIFP